MWAQRGVRLRRSEYPSRCFRLKRIGLGIGQGKEMRMGFLRALVLVALGLLVQTTALSAPQEQELVQLRSLGYSLMSNLLVYYNIDGTPYDPDNEAAYKRDLDLMQRISVKVSQVEAGEHVARLTQLIKAVHNLPQSLSEARSVDSPYPRWLMPVVEEFFSLETWLSGRIDSAHGSEAGLYQLRHDIERLGLSYQLAAFHNLGADVWILDDASVMALDASIQKRLQALSASQEDRDKLTRDYLFVRTQILNPGGRRMPNGVARYMERITTRIGELAAQ